ncbi:hypothetical protein V8F20_000798 [Naviculisporaceae sp. PSN 640]
MTSKVIIVTGAGRGIGLAIANYLLKSSHKVVLASRSEPELQQLKNQFPSQVVYLAADLTAPEAASRVTELAIQSFGRIDGVIINHGVLMPIARIADASIEEWKSLFDANFFSAVAIAKEVIPHLRTSKGSLIFTSSGAALKGYAGWGAYGSSKAALHSLVQHIAVEEPDIAAISVSPGRVDTDMQKQIREKGSAAMAEKDYAGFVTAFDEGKLNKPEWPAEVIARLSLEGKQELSGKYIVWNAPELAEYRASS